MVVAPGNRHAGSSRGRLATARTDSGEVDIALKEGWMGGGETPHTEVAERMVGGAETWQRPDDHDHIVSVVDYGSGPLSWTGMEHTDGGHFDDRAGDLPLEQSLKSVDGMTVEYAAPEQFDEAYGDIDDTTDVSQLGVVFYELFTGQPPFRGKHST